MPEPVAEPGSDALLPPEAHEVIAAEIEPGVLLETAGPKRPDITPAQLIGMVPLLAEFAHSFGIFTLSQAQQDSLSKLVIGAVGLFGADALIRLGRNLAQR